MICKHVGRLRALNRAFPSLKGKPGRQPVQESHLWEKGAAADKPQIIQLWQS